MKTGEKIIAGVLVLVVAIVVFGYFASQSSAEAYFDDASPVMYFWSATCHFCIQQKPILQELAAKGYRIKSMDVAKNPSYWQQYNVEGTPTFLAANGDRKVGLTQKEELEAWLLAHGAKVK